MSVKINASLDYYQYGINQAMVGIPEQPYAINFFIKDKELTQLTLVPQIYHKQEDIRTSLLSSLETCQQTRKKSKEVAKKVVNDNIGRALLAAVVPCGSSLKNWVVDKNKHHYSDEILNAMKGKKVIAGVAIEGNVVKAFAPELLDTLTEDTANLTHARRLMLLSTLMKSSLKTMTDEFHVSKEPLAPVVDVVVATISTLTDAVKSSERDIKEIKKRVTRLESAKETLNAEALLELNTVNKRIRTIITDQLNVMKKTAT